MGFRLKLIYFLLGLLVFFTCERKEEDDSKVFLSERQIYVNNEPYFIKGVCYHPVPKGKTVREFDKIDQDLDLMVEAGINTIRVYAPIEDLEILDKIAAKGLKLIVGFGYDQNGYYDLKSGTFINYIKQYASHSSILFWEFGNEYNYHPEWFNNDINNWYEVLNSSVLKLKQFDPTAIAATAHGEIPSLKVINLCASIDIWGLNIYRWDDPSTVFMEWETLSSKPMYLSEAGADSYMKISNHGFEAGKNYASQAKANSNILKSVIQNKTITSGVCMFSFTDGLWKVGNPMQQDIGGWAPNSSGVPYDGAPNEEHWGITDIERNKKETFNVIKSIYKSESINP